MYKNTGISYSSISATMGTCSSGRHAASHSQGTITTTYRRTKSRNRTLLVVGSFIRSRPTGKRDRKRSARMRACSRRVEAQIDGRLRIFTRPAPDEGKAGVGSGLQLPGEKPCFSCCCCCYPPSPPPPHCLRRHGTALPTPLRRYRRGSCPRGHAFGPV